MSTTWEDPAPSAALSYEELQGSLLMVEVIGHEDHIPTVHTQPGEKNPAVRVNLTVLDGTHVGDEYENALVFPKVLIGQLRPRVGKTVLGRLGKGEAKPGKNPPWRLLPATDTDRSIADQFVSRLNSAGAGAGPSSYGQPPF